MPPGESNAVSNEFEITDGSETNGSVNWARAIYERVREFRTLLPAGENVYVPRRHVAQTVRNRESSCRSRSAITLWFQQVTKKPRSLALRGFPLTESAGEIPRWA